MQQHSVYLHGTCLIVDDDGTGTGHTTLSHATSHHCSVRGHTAAGCQNALGSTHSGQILRGSLYTDHHHLMAFVMPLGSIIGEEHNLAAGSAWGGWQTTSKHLGLAQSSLVKHRMEQLVQLVGFAALNGCLLVYHTFMKQIHGNLYHGRTRTLTVTGLQEPQLTFLNSELHILHVMIVMLKFILKGVELCINLRHGLFHRRELRGTDILGDTLLLSPTQRTFLGNLLRRTDTGNDILTLCIHKILTIETVLTRCGITREAHSRCRSVAHVTEHHRHHCDGSTPLLRNTLHLTIKDGTLVHPAVEHSADGTPQLIDRIFGESLTGTLEDSLLEKRHQLLQLINVHLVVKHDAALTLHLLNDGLKRINVVFVDGFHTQHNIAVHLNKTTIAVIGKTLIAGLLSKTNNNLVVQSQIKNGVHHTRHGSTGT